MLITTFTLTSGGVVKSKYVEYKAGKPILVLPQDYYANLPKGVAFDGEIFHSESEP